MSAIEWIAAAAAAAFVALAAGTLIALRRMTARAAALQASAESMQREIEQLAQEYKRLVPPAEQAIRTAEQTVRTAQKQLQSMNRLFESASHIGGAIEKSASAVHRVSSVLSSQAAEHIERAAANRRIGEAYEWMELGLTAWQLWQSRRKESPASSEWGHMDKGHHKSERSE
ncbi:hypothetical protein ACFSL6_04615 [Paenibacillus thailandensis]|uniref:DUF948 domain-containing protein n=1 Tax=Paenibacillus thailandensis TaxID=393250 RepID=A0ABW5QZX2_9BACL